MAQSKEKEEINSKNISHKKNKKLVVITGATSGMGLEILNRLAEQGDCEIIAVGRRPQACKDITLSIREKYPNAGISFLICDLSLLNQTNELVQKITKKVQELGYNCIDVLYLNAGIYTQKIQITYEDYETQWVTNYLSPALLTEKLYPLLKNSKDARIIFVTNNKASKTKLNWTNIREPQTAKSISMYNQSKLADLMFALEFDYRHLVDENVKTFVVNPGKVCTRLGLKCTSGWRRFVNNIRNITACSVEEGIKTVMYIINASTLPSRVVLYKNCRAVMPSSYAIDVNNRVKLYNATRRMLDLPAVNRENKTIDELDAAFCVFPDN